MEHLQNFDEIVRDRMSIDDNTDKISYILNSAQELVAVSQAFKSEFLQESPKLILNQHWQKTQVAPFVWMADYSPQINEQNQFALKQSDSIGIYLDIFNQNQATKLYITYKYPLLINGEVNAVYVYMRRFVLARFMDLIFCSNSVTDFFSQETPLKYLLTQRQQMVLFLFLRNYSYTEISTWMRVFGHDISPGRINEHLARLKEIFKVDNKDQLLKVALRDGYHFNIPTGFLLSGSFALERRIVELEIRDSYPMKLTMPQLISHEFHSSLVRIFFSKNSIPLSLRNYVNSFTNAIGITDEMSYISLINGKMLVGATPESDDCLLTTINQQTSLLKEKNINQQEYVVIIEYNGERKIYLCQRHPIVDVSGELLAFHFYVRPFHVVNIPKIMSEEFSIFRFPKCTYDIEFKLTSRQHMVLFFYARNYSASQISNILSLLGFSMSLATVNEHLSNIKKILLITNKEQLINVAMLIGYHLLPGELMSDEIFSLVGYNSISRWCC